MYVCMLYVCMYAGFLASVMMYDLFFIPITIVCMARWYILTARTLLGTYLHTYLPTYIHTYIHAYIHTYVHTCLHTHIHTYTHTYLPVEYVSQPTYLPNYLQYLIRKPSTRTIILFTYLHTYLPTYIQRAKTPPAYPAPELLRRMIAMRMLLPGRYVGR